MDSTRSGMSRRQLMSAGAVLLAPLSLGQRPSKPHGATRLVFLTDSHVPGDLKQNSRFEKALSLAKQERPDVTLFGGDNVMAVDYSSTTKESADAQFANWKSLISKHVDSPHHSVIGNHDIWWTNDADAGTRKDKGYAIETFGMKHRYYAAKAGSWKVLLLDSFHKDGCKIDEEQMRWLDSETKDPKQNVLLVSHAPILTVTSYIEKDVIKPNGQIAIPASWQIANTLAVRDLLFNRPQVKLALSGHMHQIDRVLFDHCTYICGGAVSGGWWGGDYYKFPPAYLVIDLLPNGEFTSRSVYWEAAK